MEKDIKNLLESLDRITNEGSGEQLQIPVTIVFDADDIKDILDAYNNVHGTKITLDEVAASHEMQEYIKSELSETKTEIIEGSYEAIANDWLWDLKEFSSVGDEDYPDEEPEMESKDIRMPTRPKGNPDDWGNEVGDWSDREEREYQRKHRIGKTRRPRSRFDRNR